MVQLRLDPVKELDKLESIATQLEAAKDVSREGRMASQSYEKMAEKVAEWATANENRIDANEIGVTVKTLESIAAYLNPIAAVGWTKSDLEQSVEKVRAMLTLGLYDEADMERVQGVITTLATFTTPGTRAPRGQGAAIEGRPERVRITPMPSTETPNPAPITEQAGNRATSVSNLKAALIGWLVKAGLDVTDRQKDGIGEAVKSVVVDGKDNVQVGDFAVISVAPVTTEAEAPAA